jgi:hypothetical protein
VPRTLLVVGIALTLVGLLGMALTVGHPAADGWVRYLFIPCYAAGALCLIGGGATWLVRWSRRDRPSS